MSNRELCHFTSKSTNDNKDHGCQNPDLDPTIL